MKTYLRRSNEFASWNVNVNNVFEIVKRFCIFVLMPLCVRVWGLVRCEISLIFIKKKLFKKNCWAWLTLQPDERLLERHWLGIVYPGLSSFFFAIIISIIFMMMIIVFVVVVIIIHCHRSWWWASCCRLHGCYESTRGRCQGGIWGQAQAIKKRKKKESDERTRDRCAADGLRG